MRKADAYLVRHPLFLCKKISPNIVGGLLWQNLPSYKIKFFVHLQVLPFQPCVEPSFSWLYIP